ncbi:hypothetical protein THRCLA_20655 [Thraustotheca clavata]|uniref:Uncharacterized protein n=1 Tax=Thraustotheca clavata TaxID=74557 RepID=A0A1W0A505_9STRA|nr:hypothetical protein THRCLA_20655 [Thraustotheca clavata]
MFDQPVNAQVLVDLGVASRILPYQSLTAKQLADDVSDILANTKDIQTKAKNVAASLSEESSGALDSYCDVILNASPLNAKLKAF